MRTGLLALALVATAVSGCIDTDEPAWWKGYGGAAPDGSGNLVTNPEQVCTPAQMLPGGDSLRVHFIDVAQGDAIWVQTPDGHNVLIDGGDDGLFHRTDGGEIVQEYLSANGFPPGSTFDAFVLTHAHSDHYGGLQKLRNSYHASAYLDPGSEASSENYQDFVAGMRQVIPQGRFYRPAVGPAGIVTAPGQRIPNHIFGQSTEAWLLHSEAGVKDGNLNNTSIVIKLRFANRAVLLMGDIEQEVESEMRMNYAASTAEPNLNAHVLKVGHHGSSTASSSLFLNAVFRYTVEQNPYAIISSGRRSYSGTTLPTPQTIFRLQQVIPEDHVLSTEAGDDGKDEDMAPRDDDVLSVIKPDGSAYTCYVP